MHWYGRGHKEGQKSTIVDQADVAFLEQLLEELQDTVRELQRARVTLEKSYEKIRKLDDRRGRSGGRG